MSESGSAGRLVLRVTIGVLVLLHGMHKILHGLGPIPEMLRHHGLPGWIAYLVYFGEVVGPLLVILGLLTRLGAGLIVINMIVAVLLVHTGSLLALGPMGGYALELQACYLFGALAILLLGAGALSLGGRRGIFN